MKRRGLLAGASTVAATVLGGCLSDPLDGEEPPAGGTTPTDTPTDSSTPTDGNSPTPSMQDSSFEVLGVESGQGENSADVSFDDAVTVEGTIGGRNGCYTARLAAADSTDEGLRILVEAYEDKEEGEMCTEALVDIDYRATFEYEGELPERVVVEHDSQGEKRTVADEQR